MLNDRDDKFEGQDDTEYHFSDEEVSYEVEQESPKSTASTAATPKENLVNRLTRSKRMLISLAVFFVLIFVVYKMVSPGTTAVPTDITAPAVASQQNVTQPQNSQQVQAATANTMNQPPAQIAQTTPPAMTQQPAQPVMSQPAVNQMPPAMNNVPEQPMASAQPMQPPQQAPVSMQQTTPPAMTQQPVAQPVMSQPIVNQIPPPPPVAMQQQQQQMSPQQQQQVVNANGMPTVIPVQSAPAPQQQVTVVQSPAGSASPLAVMTADSDKLVNQLQTQAAEKVNEFATQNKALQDQVQLLNSRVASMESQMTQLIQALTQKASAGATPDSPPPPPAAAQPQTGMDPKVSYNVQAIIPGRAWLRSDNGETVTVAEGDVVKDLGRVTKIDPYDGVVEINTGAKAISLSYGNGGVG